MQYKITKQKMMILESYWRETVNGSRVMGVMDELKKHLEWFLKLVKFKK